MKKDNWMLVVSLILCAGSLIVKHFFSMPLSVFLPMGLAGIALFVIYDIRDNRAKKLAPPEHPQEAETADRK